MVPWVASCGGWQPCPWQQVGTGWSLWSPSNLSHSVVQILYLPCEITNNELHTAVKISFFFFFFLEAASFMANNTTTISALVSIWSACQVRKVLNSHSFLEQKTLVIDLLPCLLCRPNQKNLENNIQSSRKGSPHSSQPEKCHKSGAC